MNLFLWIKLELMTSQIFWCARHIVGTSIWKKMTGTPRLNGVSSVAETCARFLLNAGWFGPFWSPWTITDSFLWSTFRSTWLFFFYFTVCGRIWVKHYELNKMVIATKACDLCRLRIERRIPQRIEGMTSTREDDLVLSSMIE